MQAKLEFARSYDLVRVNRRRERQSLVLELRYLVACVCAEQLHICALKSLSAEKINLFRVKRSYLRHNVFM